MPRATTIYAERQLAEHDLDCPVIGSTSPYESPSSQAQHQIPPAVPPLRPTHHKKSICAVVSDHKSKTSNATSQNMPRKRSTKLWGSRLEEVTPSQTRGSALSSATNPPQGVSKLHHISRWVKGELIAKGTHGRVYLALEVTTGEMIVVKQVELPWSLGDEDSRQMQLVEALKSESDTLKHLDHPNIVQYLGFEQSTEYFSIFFKYVPGGSIGGCLQKQGKFDRDVVRYFTSQILVGLEYLHSHGILHGNLKADNILVDSLGNCKISGFGLSKRSTNIYDNDTALTAIQGSIFWMAPEVLHNYKQGYNAKIDIWSLGCVVLEMWTEARPWDQEEMVAVMFKLGALREAPSVPKDLELNPIENGFKQQCFIVNPAERPTATELRKHKFLEPKQGWMFTGFS